MSERRKQHPSIPVSALPASQTGEPSAQRATSLDAPVGAIELAPTLESLMQLAFYWCESQTDFLVCVSSAYALVATEEFIPEQYAQISKISAWARRRLEEMPEASSAILDDVAMKDDAVQAHIRRVMPESPS